MDVSTLKARVNALLTESKQDSESPHDTSYLLQGALTVMSAAYGTESRQVTALLESTKIMHNTSVMLHVRHREAFKAIRGALENLKGELDAGLAGSLQKRMAGEVLVDFIQLAKVVLDKEGDDAKNVAAVLAAAAYEDTIRRMGAEFAGVMGRDELSDVIIALKKAEVLQSPHLGIALSYLNFSNRALHANWEQIDRSAVNSALGFVEQLLLKHFQ